MSIALSVIVPAFNEERRLGETLDRVLGFLRQRGETYEVLVVDDGSTDSTVALASGFASQGVSVLRLERNCGKGAALRRGMLAATGQRVLFTDADLSTPIEDLDRLEPHLARAPIVFGSRAVEGAEIDRRQPLYRELMGRTFNLILRLLGIGSLRDTQCGFKLFDGDVARHLFADLTVERFAFDVELVLLARRRGLAIAEVGVRWADSPSSRVHPLRDSSRMLWDVVRLRLRALRQR